MKILILGVLAFSLFLSNAQAAPLTFKCDFPIVINDEHGPESQNFTFDIRIDTVTQDAIILGNNGHSKIHLITMNDDQLAFLEVTPSGSLMTTTVVRPTYKAVHSRHTVVTGMGDMVESQQYGTCIPE